ncbi:hypothetical protein [Streptomyces sp. NPDC056480]|uniref:hypothetical protein n=1 Tax=Streptomyces sp. NPDC056480 TaxID=3345833 RepID=UPI00369CB032
MDLETGRDEELPELLGPVTPVKGADDLACGDVQGSEPSDGADADVVVRGAPGIIGSTG